jgi:carboxylesterase type B
VVCFISLLWDENCLATDSSFWEPGGDAGGAGSEDCLKVNIYAPAGAKRGSNRALI